VTDWLFLIALAIIFIVCICLFLVSVVMMYGVFASFVGFTVGAFWGSAVHAFHLFN